VLLEGDCLAGVVLANVFEDLLARQRRRPILKGGQRGCAGGRGGMAVRTHVACAGSVDFVGLSESGAGRQDRGKTQIVPPLRLGLSIRSLPHPALEHFRVTATAPQTATPPLDVRTSA